MERDITMEKEEYINRYEWRSKPDYDEIVTFTKDLETEEEVNDCIKQNMWEDDADNIYDIWKEIKTNPTRNT